MDLTTLERLPLWIGGRTVAAHTTRYGEVTNPATGEVLMHVPLASRAVAAPCTHPHALSRVDGSAQERARPSGFAGAWQDDHRCRRLDYARYRSRRVRDRNSAFAQGRVQRQRGQRRGWILDAAAPRRMRRD